MGRLQQLIFSFYREDPRVEELLETVANLGKEAGVG